MRLRPGPPRSGCATRAWRRSSSASSTRTPTPPTSSEPAPSRARSCRTRTSRPPTRSCPSGGSTSASPRRSYRAYTGPVVERYLRTLVARLAEEGFTGNLLMMLSDGLVATVDYCIPRVVYLIGSGPRGRTIWRAPHRAMRSAPGTSCPWTWAAPRSTSAWCATGRSRPPPRRGSRTSAWPSRWSTSSRAALAAGRSPGSTSWACCGSGHGPPAAIPGLPATARAARNRP